MSTYFRVFLAVPNRAVFRVAKTPILPACDINLRRRNPRSKRHGVVNIGTRCRFRTRSYDQVFGGVRLYLFWSYVHKTVTKNYFKNNHCYSFMGHNYFITFTIGYTRKKTGWKLVVLVMYFYFVPVIVQRNTVTLTSQRSYVRTREKGVNDSRVAKNIDDCTEIERVQPTFYASARIWYPKGLPNGKYFKILPAQTSESNLQGEFKYYSTSNSLTTERDRTLPSYKGAYTSTDTVTYKWMICVKQKKKNRLSK